MGASIKPATTSFIESELIRKGHDEFDLSEMFIVRYNYTDRLKDNYLRQGKGNIEPGGGQAHDWITVFRENGLVPEEVYRGLNYSSSFHNHSELNDYIVAVAAVAVERKNESSQYYKIVDAILDSYLGPVQETFLYKGKSYTPKSFAASLDINPEDYVEIPSFSHFPFYTRGVLEVPDNWRMERFYNVPLDELFAVLVQPVMLGMTMHSTNIKTIETAMGMSLFSCPLLCLREMKSPPHFETASLESVPGILVERYRFTVFELFLPY